MFLLYPLALGVLVGLARGGSLARVAAARFRHAWLLLGALLVQVVIFSPWLAESEWNLRWSATIWVGSLLAALVGIVLNLRQPGFAVAALGAALNLAAVLANGGRMPAAPEALALLHGPEGVAALAAGTVVTNSALAGPETALVWLTDIFVLPPWLPGANVFSVGDVLIGLGAFLWLQATLLAPARTVRVT